MSTPSLLHAKDHSRRRDVLNLGDLVKQIGLHFPDNARWSDGDAHVYKPTLQMQRLSAVQKFCL